MKQNRLRSEKTPRRRQGSPTRNGPIRYTPRTLQRTNAPKSELSYIHERHPTKPKPPPEKPPIPSYLPKKKKEKKNEAAMEIEPLIQNQKCIELREKLLEDANFDDIQDDDLRLLQEHLREYSQAKAIDRDYDAAERADLLNEQIHEELERREMEGLNAKDRGIPEDEEQCIKSKEEAFKKELKDYDKATKIKRSNLEKKQSRDLDDFEKLWKDEMPRKYRKPTPKLIGLIEIERKISLAGDFAKAKIAKQDVERQQTYEMQQAQRQLIKDYAVAKKKFEQGQLEEKELFENTRQHWRDVIVARQKVEMSSITNRKQVLTIKQNQQVKPKENTVHSKTRTPQGCAIKLRREGQNRQNDCLLPPLLPPNDERIVEMQEQEREFQRKRNKQFIEEQLQKELEADRSQSEYYEEGVSVADSDSLPAHKLQATTNEKVQALLQDLSETSSSSSSDSDSDSSSEEQAKPSIDENLKKKTETNKKSTSKPETKSNQKKVESTIETNFGQDPEPTVVDNKTFNLTQASRSLQEKDNPAPES